MLCVGKLPTLSLDSCQSQTQSLSPPPTFYHHPPTFGIPPPPEVFNRHKHTLRSCLSGDLLHMEFPQAFSGSALPCSPPHFTPHPTRFIVLIIVGVDSAINKPLLSRVYALKRLSFCLSFGIICADLASYPVDYLLVEMQPLDQSNPLVLSPASLLHPSPFPHHVNTNV